MKPRHIFFNFLLMLTLVVNVGAQTAPARRTSIAVLDFGETKTGQRAADKLAAALAVNADFALADRDESRAAARGAGYAGSLNLTLSEARDLGSALGADFYLTGDAQTVRRSPSDRPAYYEAYASLFLVSTRTGRLVMWDFPSFEAVSPEAAEKLLLAALGSGESRHRYLIATRRAQEDERNERARAVELPSPLIEDAPDEASPEATGVRLPAPYRRLQPAYPETAARARVEAVVDVLVEIDAAGEVGRVEVVRWAGYGLDEATVQTVRQLHFRPAMRDGLPVPLRVLLRYNFRRPQK
ncbi:MAG TPA: TonB family protein [Pyrinomonadaceae bacterium]|jgi:TonB family protein